MSAELLQHLQAFRQSIVSARTINDFLATNGSEHMLTTDHYKTKIDWTLLRVVKGFTYGLYMEMWNDGVKAIGNQILLEEGMPQQVNQKRLAEIDTLYSLK